MTPGKRAGRPAGRARARKVMTLVSATALGADCIDDCDLRPAVCQPDSQVLGHQIAAPFPLGRFYAPPAVGCSCYPVG